MYFDIFHAKTTRHTSHVKSKQSTLHQKDHKSAGSFHIHSQNPSENMLSRAFTKRRRSIKDGEHTKFSRSIHEYDDYIVGFTYDLPLISCENRGVQMTMKEVLRSSVGVMGESSLGMTEKVVLLNGEMFAVKRFRKLIVGRSEFGRRVEKLAQLSRKCEYLVPITAYLYAKRIKFILCDYYPMGSLADLLACESYF